MNAQTAICKIREVDGVTDVVIFEDGIADRIRDEEETVRSVAGPDVVNMAYTETYRREVRLCLFCDRRIMRYEESSMTLEDRDGNVLGMILTESMISEYKDRADVLWVSEDFIMFPDIAPTGGERFILKPMRFPVLDESDGFYDAVLSSPAPSSDVLIQRHYGVSLKEELATLIVGFNVSGKGRSRKA
jgi:hypothetical protein